MNNTKFSDSLKQILSDKDMTQADLVRLSGLSKSTISQYCSGNIAPNIKNVTKIALALNIDANILIGTLSFDGMILHSSRDISNVNNEMLAKTKLIAEANKSMLMLDLSQLEDLLLYIKFRVSLTNK